MSYQTKDHFTGNVFKEILPYGGKLNPDNRWIKLSHLVPWEILEGIYRKYFSPLGRPAKDSRLINGLIIAKHLGRYSDEEIVVEEFQENIYLQYFCGYDQLVVGQEIHPTTLSKMRKRVGQEYFSRFEEEILKVLKDKKLIRRTKEMQLDATVFPVNITYPTDVGLLDKARRWVVGKIKVIKKVVGIKDNIRTYARKAKQVFLSFSKKRKRTGQEVRRVTRQMLQYLSRNLKQIKGLLDKGGEVISGIESGIRQRLEVIEKIYQQQFTMFKEKVHRISERIVSIHRSHIRPIVRRKNGKEVEFGPKCLISYVDGYGFLDEFGYEAYNEGGKLEDSLELHKKRFGVAPKVVIGDQIFGSKQNRNKLKELGIEGSFMPLGRCNNISSTEIQRIKKRQKRRGRMEGIIGHSKMNFGLDRLRYANEKIEVMLGLIAMNLKTAVSRV